MLKGGPVGRGDASRRQLSEDVKNERHDGQQHEGWEDAHDERDEHRDTESLSGDVEFVRSLASKVVEQELEMQIECRTIEFAPSKQFENSDQARVADAGPFVEVRNRLAEIGTEVDGTKQGRDLPRHEGKATVVCHLSSRHERGARRLSCGDRNVQNDDKAWECASELEALTSGDSTLAEQPTQPHRSPRSKRRIHSTPRPSSNNPNTRAIRPAELPYTNRPCNADDNEAKSTGNSTSTPADI